LQSLGGDGLASTANGFSADDSRKLLACLIFLDELAAHEQNPPGWVPSARAVLRDWVAQCGRFVVLGDQLIGRPLAEVAKLVVAVGHVSTSRVPPGQIGRIRQPGYALKQEGLVADVICPAKVLIARAPAS
jgi:hypothetical protein